MREGPVRDISGDDGGNLGRFHEGSTIHTKDDRAQNKWRKVKEAKPSELVDSSMPCADRSLWGVCSCIRYYQADMWSVTAQPLPFWGRGAVCWGGCSEGRDAPDPPPPTSSWNRDIGTIPQGCLPVDLFLKALASPLPTPPMHPLCSWPSYPPVPFTESSSPPPILSASHIPW